MIDCVQSELRVYRNCMISRTDFSFGPGMYTGHKLEPTHGLYCTCTDAVVDLIPLCCDVCCVVCGGRIALCIFVFALVGGYVYVILDQRKILLGAANAEREKRARSAAASAGAAASDDGKRDSSASQGDVKTPANSRVSAASGGGSNGGPAIAEDDREDVGLLAGNNSSSGLPGWYVDNFDGPPVWNDMYALLLTPAVLHTTRIVWC